jgi:hypothetical protein
MHILDLKCPNCPNILFAKTPQITIVTLDPFLPFILFFQLHFFLQNRDNLTVSSLKYAHVSHVRHFLSILIPRSNGWATSQQNDNLRGSSVTKW